MKLQKLLEFLFMATLIFIYLFYDMDGEWVGYFVRAKTNYNLFNLDGDWKGKYLCSDSESGYSLFEEGGEWT